jgi:deazaflavin-dependent oxidoreductase (nitroreductase family)
MAQTKKSGAESTVEARAAARQRARELNVQKVEAAALKSVLNKIASLDKPDKTNAERIHAIVIPGAREVQGSLRQPRVLRAGTARRWHDVGPPPTLSPSSHRPTRRSSWSSSARRSGIEALSDRAWRAERIRPRLELAVEARASSSRPALADPARESAAARRSVVWHAGCAPGSVVQNLRDRHGPIHAVERLTPAERSQPGSVPLQVRLFSPILAFLLRAGVPLGFNRLVTIRGRKSGLPRTTPIAVIEASGRRWVWAPWGDVQWVRNLRAAKRATIQLRGRKEELRATELDPTQRVAFFRDVIGPLARRIPFGVAFIRIVDGVDLNDPVEAAEGRPVFELTSM